VIRFLLLSILIMLVARAVLRLWDGVLGGLIGSTGGRRPRASRTAISSTLARDPVCGTYVVPQSAITVQVGRVTHHFCSEGCRDTFTRDGGARARASAS
jgi:YHS domain-containing protein